MTSDVNNVTESQYYTVPNKKGQINMTKLELNFVSMHGGKKNVKNQIEQEIFGTVKERPPSLLSSYASSGKRTSKSIGRHASPTPYKSFASKNSAMTKTNNS